MSLLGLRACARGQPLLNSVAASLAAGRWQSAQRSAARPAALVGARHFTRGERSRIQIDDYGLMSDYIAPPISASPSIFSKKGVVALKDRVVNRATMVVSLLVLKFMLSGWKGDLFAAQAEDLYGAMNVAYGRGDVRALGEICSPKMLRVTGTEIKARNVDFDWAKTRTLSTPRVVQLRCGRVTSSIFLSQVTVRIDQEQQVTSRPRGGARSKASQGAPRTVRVREYIVLQRVVSDEAAPWTIYGKIPVPSWDQPKN